MSIKKFVRKLNVFSGKRFEVPGTVRDPKFLQKKLMDGLAVAARGNTFILMQNGNQLYRLVTREEGHADVMVSFVYNKSGSDANYVVLVQPYVDKNGAGLRVQYHSNSNSVPWRVDSPEQFDHALEKLSATVRKAAPSAVEFDRFSKQRHSHVHMG